ncbi:hypothetical protein BH10ACT1_BH10ACT1_06150 [soil metagenome]
MAYSSGGAIWRSDVTGGPRAQVSPTPDSATSYSAPTLSLDGRYVTYRIHRVDWNGLAVTDQTTGTTWQLIKPTEDAYDTSSASISEDGRWVAYVKNNSSVAGNAPQAYLWDRTTNASSRLTTVAYPIRIGGISVSGDGTHVSYLRYDPSSQGSSIVLVSRPDKTSRTVVSANRPVDSTVLSRDGHHLSFCTTASNVGSGGTVAPNLYVWNG